MKLQRDNSSNHHSSIWIYLLFFAVLLLLIKFFFIGTYYVTDEEIPPGQVKSNSLLIVSIQSMPQSEGDIILLELPSRDLRPVLYISRSKGVYQVQVGDDVVEVQKKMIKGKVIGRIQS